MSMKIAVDAMGGDNAPKVEVAGAVSAARDFSISIILVGDKELLTAELLQHNTSGLDITIKHASEVVGMHDNFTCMLDCDEKPTGIMLQEFGSQQFLVTDKDNGYGKIAGS